MGRRHKENFVSDMTEAKKIENILQFVINAKLLDYISAICCLVKDKFVRCRYENLDSFLFFLGIRLTIFHHFLNVLRVYVLFARASDMCAHSFFPGRFRSRLPSTFQ